MQNDLLSAINGGSASSYWCLILCAAFDTTDHQILLSCLHNMYSIRGDVRAWFKSYLSGRTQCVNINVVLSDTKKLTFVVPQVSILRPTMYCFKTKQVSDIIRSFVVLKITLNRYGKHTFKMGATTLWSYLLLLNKKKSNDNTTFNLSFQLLWDYSLVWCLFYFIYYLYVTHSCLTKALWAGFFQWW